MPESDKRLEELEKETESVLSALLEELLERNNTIERGKSYADVLAMREERGG